MNICVFISIHYQADMNNLLFCSLGAAKGRYTSGPQKKSLSVVKKDSWKGL